MATNEVAPTPSTEAVNPPSNEGVVKEEGSSSTRPSSPDPSCPICLDNVNDAAYTDMCCHRFCFQCLVSWSRVKPECPLCKQRFSLIIHNVRSMCEYDELRVGWTDPPPPSLDANFFISVAFQRPRFRYRTTNGGWGWRLQHFLRGHPSHDVLPTSSFPSTIPTPSTTNTLVAPLPSLPSNEFPPNVASGTFIGNTVATEWRRRRQVSACEFRSNVYRQNMWIHPTQPRPGVPYRVRECSPSFYRNNPAQINRLLPWLHRELLVLLDVRHNYEEVCQRIIHAITNIPIRSPRFQAMMWPYLHERTSHFCHEFYYFATSPYDMLAYDMRTEYVRRDPDHTEPPASDNENYNNSDSSDIEIVEPDPVTQEYIEISDDNDDDVVRVDNDSDASIEIISELPPLAEREPEIIDLVEDSGPDLPPSPAIPGPSCSEEKKERVRLRNKFQPYYKDESTSSEEDIPRRRQVRKRRRKGEPVKKRKRTIEAYSSSDSDISSKFLNPLMLVHPSVDCEQQTAEPGQTRSKTKYQPPSSSSHSEDKSSSSKSSTSVTSGSTTKSSDRSQHRRKKSSSQPLTSKHKNKEIKKNEESVGECMVKNEPYIPYSSITSHDYSPCSLSPLIDTYNSPEYDTHEPNNQSFKWSSPLRSDDDSIIDEQQSNPSISHRQTPSPKPRLKSVVRKVEPLQEAGCSTWPVHNLRQRKLTRYAYTHYFSPISDSDS